MFYHFTSATYHLPRIMADGVIKTTESNIGSGDPGWPPMGANYGPPVVWLLDTPDTGSYSHGLAGSFHDKREARIAVDVPAIRWFDWAPAQEMHAKWRERLIVLGGGEEAAAHWYVFPAPIRRVRWRGIALGHTAPGTHSSSP